MATITTGLDAKNKFDGAAFLAVGLTVIFWASSFVMIRLCLESLSPVELATARYMTAGLLALAYLAYCQVVPSRSDLLRISIAAVLFIASYSVLLNAGERTVPAGPASFIINTMPVFTALIATFALGERFG